MHFRERANGKESVEEHDREFDEARGEHIETFVGKSDLHRSKKYTLEAAQ